MNIEKVKIAAALFASAPDSDCECEATDLYYEVKDAAKSIDWENTAATQAFVEDVRKACIAAGLTDRTATSFGNIAKSQVELAYIPF